MKLLKNLLTSVTAGVSVNSVDEPADYDDFGILKTSAVTYGKFIPKENKKVVKRDVLRLKSKVIEDTILMSRMNTPLLVGASVYIKHDYKNLYIPDRIWRMQVNKKITSILWLSYSLSSLNARKVLTDISTGTSNSMKNISKIKLYLVNIITPPLPEQEVIANVLSDMDALIESIEQLIQKNKNIKQGAMQQLLTGKIRLYQNGSGYKKTDLGVIPEEWEVKQLGVITHIIDPHPSHRAPPENKYGIPFVGIGDIDTTGRIDTSNVRMVDEDIFYEHRKRYQLDFGLIGIGRVASIGKIILFKKTKEFYVISPTMAIVKPININHIYLYYSLKSKNSSRQFDLLSNGSTRQSVGIMLLRKIQIPLPPLPEQEAIARVLSTLDEEIEALEAQRSKYQTIKQGAMQQLLTGQIRLV